MVVNRGKRPTSDYVILLLLLLFWWRKKSIGKVNTYNIMYEFIKGVKTHLSIGNLLIFTFNLISMY